MCSTDCLIRLVSLPSPFEPVEGVADTLDSAGLVETLVSEVRATLPVALVRARWMAFCGEAGANIILKEGANWE